MEKINPIIRTMILKDIQELIDRFTFPWTTPEQTSTIWETNYYEQQNGVRTVAIVEKNDKIVGYGSLLRKSQYPNFLSANIPEVNSIWIDENYRKQGYGTALIKWLEKLAIREDYTQIGIGVGLYQDYGPAQRLYFQLGYVPDGQGITYKGQPTIAGQSYPLDDDLILWLTKSIAF